MVQPLQRAILVSRQFKTIPGIMEGKGKPDYSSCVEISTQAALKEMMLPGLMAVAAPLLCGVILGSSALGGLLAGALVTGVLMAIFMANSGGAKRNNFCCRSGSVLLFPRRASAL